MKKVTDLLFSKVRGQSLETPCMGLCMCAWNMGSSHGQRGC